MKITQPLENPGQGDFMRKKTTPPRPIKKVWAGFSEN